MPTVQEKTVKLEAGITMSSPLLILKMFSSITNSTQMLQSALAFNLSSTYSKKVGQELPFWEDALILRP